MHLDPDSEEVAELSSQDLGKESLLRKNATPTHDFAVDNVLKIIPSTPHPKKAHRGFWKNRKRILL